MVCGFFFKEDKKAINNHKYPLNKYVLYEKYVKY